MAAPTKTARIGLLFDDPSLENSWFLVDFSRHAKISDVESEIKECFSSDACGKVVLKINNFLLPSASSCKLFRENDTVYVRFEKPVQSEIQASCDTDCLSRKRVCSRIDGNTEDIVFGHSSAGRHELQDYKTKKRRHSEMDSNLENSDTGKKHKSSKHKKKKHSEEFMQHGELIHELAITDKDQYKAKKSKGRKDNAEKDNDSENRNMASGDAMQNGDELKEKDKSEPDMSESENGLFKLWP